MSNYLSEFQKKEALELLINTINITTVNPVGNEKILADFIASYLSDVGCLVEVHEFQTGRANVFASIKGSESGNALMLNGHLDTVPFGSLDGWTNPPDKAFIKDDMLYGRGSSDMKGGLCAALYAFKSFALEKILPQNDIIFLGTADEEFLGLGAQVALEKGIMADVGKLIIGEPTGNSIAVASKGTLWLEITVIGKTSHGAYPWEGLNSAEISFKLIEEIKNIFGNEGHKYLSKPTCTLTKINAGVKSNMVPDICKLTLDIRTIPSTNHKRYLNNVDKIIREFENNYEGLEISYSVLNDRMAVEIDSQHILVKSLSNSIKDVCKTEPDLIGTNFFSDASIFLRKYDIPTVLFGPGESSEAHKPNEKLSLKEYFKSIECYYNFLKR